MYKLYVRIYIELRRIRGVNGGHYKAIKVYKYAQVKQGWACALDDSQYKYVVLVYMYRWEWISHSMMIYMHKRLFIFTSTRGNRGVLQNSSIFVTPPYIYCRLRTFWLSR